MAREETIILTRKGAPLVAVKSLAGSDWESLSLANNSKFIAIIEESRRSYREQGGIGLNEIRKQLGLKPRKKPPAKRRGVNGA
jgi:hypothetical protein